MDPSRSPSGCRPDRLPRTRGDGPVEYGEHVLLAVVSPHCPAGMDVVDLLNPQVTVDIPRQWPQRVVQVGVRAIV